MEEKSFFGGTAYLGMPHNEEFKKLVFEGIDKYGTNFGASRNNNVTLDVFAMAEEEAARRSGAEDSIIVSSGYMAAQLVIQHFSEKVRFLYAPDTHPALWLGQPSPPKISFNEWSEQALDLLKNSEEPILLITNSLNNLFPEIYGFEWLNEIDSNRKVTLLVDDSHGLGITGKNGEGVYPRIPKLQNLETIVIASMAKAIGVDAGVILGSKEILNELRTSPVYAGASPPAPGMLFAYCKASAIYSQELEKLRDNMKFFTGYIGGEKNISYLKEFPVYLLDNARAGEYLSSKGILISSFAYPDPTGKALNRVVLNSRHTKEQMRKLAESVVLLNKKY
ncbi:pyridoxal phosphate-dependent aminotransferase family protein [Daejeonella lutea]|uniref:7-keto-8-aminopelargonate synthetase n=1 Tax=Daejeonella lutea TaxID=572036 RepID=A0A1T5DLQ9_9SPHI|nr:pyridoxal phosphate-dependent aminotransferase family protein [Daejeonella lutea]SKB72616.1 7-keto-8-aminopelargonate synthetase [Daejeonella lutea]